MPGYHLPPRTNCRKGLGLIILGITLTIGLLFYLQELNIREKQSYLGVPRAEKFLSQQGMARIFRNEGFMLGYSEIRRNPLWVSYRLEAQKTYKVGKRPRHFRTDQRSLARVNPKDYKHSGYDRGHLAPNYAIARQYGRQGQLETFLMTNITPQKRNLNQKLWQRLEEVEIDYFARWFDQIWIITGPIFDNSPSYLESGVEIPDAFYKIFAIPGNRPRLIAFITPQMVHGQEPLNHFLTTVDEIEQRTGLDFFHQLEDKLEQELESGIDAKGWRLEQVAKLPPRY